MNPTWRARAREIARDLAGLFVSAAVTAFIVAGAPLSWAILPVIGTAGLVAVSGQIVLLLTPLTKRYGAFQKRNTEPVLEKLPV